METRNLKPYRVSMLPETLEPDAMYITPDPGDSRRVVITCTGLTGEVSRSTFSEADILELIRQEVSPITTEVYTFRLPNVGDVCNVYLDEIIRINYEKTTNAGYEGYKVNLYAVGADREIAFRRDTIYDNTSAEGYNNNHLMLSEATGFVSDSLTYGTMRDVTRKIIVDYSTMISWDITVYGFGDGYLRFIVKRFQES